MDAIVDYITRYREVSRTKIRLLRACNVMVEDHNARYKADDDIGSALVLSRLSQLLTMAKFQGYLTQEEVELVYNELTFEYPLEQREGNEEEQAGRSD